MHLKMQVQHLRGVEDCLQSIKEKGKDLQEQITNSSHLVETAVLTISDLQSLSGAMERNHDMVYVCYDNGAYMNTGIQRSSATPMFADTTTTPVGNESNGKMQNRKDLASIIADHDIPYVAQTTFIRNFKDLSSKV